MMKRRAHACYVSYSLRFIWHETKWSLSNQSISQCDMSRLSRSRRHCAAFLCLIATLPQWQSSHMWHFSLCVLTYVWHIFHQEWPACSDMTALPWSCVCVYMCVWGVSTVTTYNTHMQKVTHEQSQTAGSWVTWLFGVVWHAHWPAARQNREFAVSSSPYELREHKKRAEIEWISICIISPYLLIHDSAASLLNAGSSKEISLPEDWRAGQLHSRD